jgi:adenylyltransferase/sulfurtransferase
VHLVRAGAGEVVLIDRDVVEESNLPRQMLYNARDAAEGLPKAEAAARHLADLGGPSRLEARVKDFSRRTADELLAGADLVLDGLDNFEGRFLLNDWCHLHEVPWVYGGAVGGHGMALLVPAGGRPCLRCLFPAADETAPAETCETVGVLSPLPSLIAALQVCEAFRHLAAAPGGPPPASRLWHLDPWSGRSWVTDVAAAEGGCPCCHEGRHPALEREDTTRTATLCGRGTIQVLPSTERSLSLEEICSGWKGLGRVQRTPFLARLTCEEVTVSVFPDGRALIHGAEDVERARSLYARYVGC